MNISQGSVATHLSVVGSLTTSLLTNYCKFSQWENFENRHLEKLEARTEWHFFISKAAPRSSEDMQLPFSHYHSKTHFPISMFCPEKSHVRALKI